MSDKIRIGVLFGGQSSEYSVSLHSVSSALRSMPEEYEVLTFGITSDGNWYQYEGSIDAIEHDHWLEGTVYPATLSLNPGDHGFLVHKGDKVETVRIDVLFPIMHGLHGEDGTVQGACELAGIPCVGCGMTSSAICMDKEYTHVVMEHAGIPMAKWFCVRKEEGYDAKKLYEKTVMEFGLPCIIKPCNAGSSYGVSKAKDFESFRDGLEDAFRYDRKLIVEEFLNGFEVGCAVLGQVDPLLGEPDEIEISTDIFDFVEKYNLVTSKIHVPARVSPEMKEKIYASVRTVYRALDCKGMARVDCFVVGEEVYLNEVNTIPGFTSASRYPSMMKAKGYSFTDVIRMLIRETLK